MSMTSTHLLIHSFITCHIVAVYAVLWWDARAVCFVPFAFRAEQSVAAELNEVGVIMP
jgi:hypothetical protein